MESEPSSQPVESLTSAVLLYGTITLGIAFLVKRMLTSPSLPDNVPPFPVKPYPVLGHLPYFKKGGMRKVLKEWAEKTGPIMSLKFGPNLVVLLSGYDMIHKGFVKHADTLSDRPLSINASSGGADPNKGIVTASGPVWKEQRTVALHILRAFGMGKNMLAEKIKEEISAYLNTLADLRGAPSDVRIKTRTAIANIICAIIIGNRFEYDDVYFMEFTTRLSELFKVSQVSSLNSIFPWLKYLPGDLFNAKKRVGLFRYIMDFFCLRYIEKIKKEDSNHANENFISAYLLEKQRREEMGQDTTLDDENLSRALFSLFVAGTDTTSNFLTWFTLYMVRNPDIQAKVYAEILDVVGTERAPDMQDKKKLNLTMAAVIEALRISNNPLGLPHMCREDTEIDGYTIPAGATVLTHIDSMLRSDQVWKEPTKYDPYRFLDANGVFTQPEEFVPFGLGRRACPAESMARMELYLFAAALIQRFELQPEEPGVMPSLIPFEGLVYVPQPFKVRFVDRRHK